MSKMKSNYAFTMLMVAVSGCSSNGKEFHDVGEGSKNLKDGQDLLKIPTKPFDHFLYDTQLV